MHVHVHSFMQDALVSQPGCAAKRPGRRPREKADEQKQILLFLFFSFFPQCVRLFVRCSILQRGKAPRTLNIPPVKEALGAGGRSVSFPALREPAEARRLPSEEPPRQARRSLCNACPRSTGGGGGRRGAGGGGGVSKQGRVQECTPGQSTPRRGMMGAAP